MEDSATKSIVLLGKTGVGKSSLANTLLKTDKFKTNDTVNSETKRCNVLSGSVNERSLTLIDTPGFFDTEMSEQELRSEILQCMTKCASGIHAFLILLKVEKITAHEKAVIERIFEYFSDDLMKYCVLVFTHGDQIPDGTEVKEFIGNNKFLSDLLKKCGGRCITFDNKYWDEKPETEYRSNKFQVKNLLQTIDMMVESNNGDCYTNEMLRVVKEEIQQEEEKIRLQPGTLSESEIRQQAEVSVFKKLMIRLAGTATGVLLGALFGMVVMVGAVMTLVRKSEKPIQLKEAITETAITVGATAGGTAAAAAAATTLLGGAVAATAIGAPAAATFGLSAVVGGGKGLAVGWRSAEEAATAKEAAEKTVEAVMNEAQEVLNTICEWKNKSYKSPTSQND